MLRGGGGVKRAEDDGVEGVEEEMGFFFCEGCASAPVLVNTSLSLP